MVADWVWDKLVNRGWLGRSGPRRRAQGCSSSVQESFNAKQPAVERRGRAAHLVAINYDPATNTGSTWVMISRANVVMCGNSAAEASHWCAKEEGVPFRKTLNKSFEGGTPLWLQGTTLLT